MLSPQAPGQRVRQGRCGNGFISVVVAKTTKNSGHFLHVITRYVLSAHAPPKWHFTKHLQVELVVDRTRRAWRPSSRSNCVGSLCRRAGESAVASSDRGLSHGASRVPFPVPRSSLPGALRVACFRAGRRRLCDTRAQEREQGRLEQRATCPRARPPLSLRCGQAETPAATLWQAHTPQPASKSVICCSKVPRSASTSATRRVRSPRLPLDSRRPLTHRATTGRCASLSLPVAKVAPAAPGSHAARRGA